MMRHVGAPEKIYFVPPAMRPIKNEIKQKKTCKPRPNICLQMKKCPMFSDIIIYAKNKYFCEQPDNLISNTDIQISNGIIEAVIFLFPLARYKHFNSDQQEEKREGKKYCCFQAIIFYY